jgi:hypothetical protein
MIMGLICFNINLLVLIVKGINYYASILKFK